MIKFLLTGFLILLFSLASRAQENSTEPSSDNTIELTPIGTENSGQDEWDIELYDQRIEEMQSKIDWVKEDEAREQEAIEMGWMTESEEALADLQYERDCYAEKFGYGTPVTDKVFALMDEIEEFKNSFSETEVIEDNIEYQEMIDQLVKLKRCMK